jgi:threonine aldolase
LAGSEKIDLRSDFIARPTEAMIDAIVEALRAPGSFELREDPRQRELERAAADLLGKEDALLFPTCTMANQAAIAVACRPGELLVAEAESHVLTSEAGAPAAVSGVLARGLPGRTGQMDLVDLEHSLAAPGDELRARPALIVLENTHNRSAGAVLPIAYHQSVAAVARAAGVPIHLDGARLFNACTALGTSAAAVAAHVTTVSISLNKGLCAPAGAVLAGPAPIIRQALTVRQRLGGGMRPLGFIAAAGLEALRAMPGRLAEDHAHAALVAAGLMDTPGLTAIVPTPITNIVVVAIHRRMGTPAVFLRRLDHHGVQALPFGPDRIRLVFHREIDRHAAELTLAALKLAVAEAPL